MEDFENEVCEIDKSLDITLAMYQILKATISHNVDLESLKSSEFPFNKKLFVESLVQMNMKRLREALFLTTGPENRIYLCGKWLRRPVFYNEKMISTLAYLKMNFPDKNLIFEPRISGEKMRKKLWFSKGEPVTSFNIPKAAKLNDFFDDDCSNMPIMLKSQRNLRGLIQMLIRRFTPM